MGGFPGNESQLLPLQATLDAAGETVEAGLEPRSPAFAGGCVCLRSPGLSCFSGPGRICCRKAWRSRGRSSSGASGHLRVLLCRRVGWHGPRLRSPGSSFMRRDGWRGRCPQTPNGPRGLSACSVLPRFSHGGTENPASWETPGPLAD